MTKSQKSKTRRGKHNPAQSKKIQDLFQDFPQNHTKADNLSRNKSQSSKSIKYKKKTPLIDRKKTVEEPSKLTNKQKDSGISRRSNSSLKKTHMLRSASHKGPSRSISRKQNKRNKKLENESDYDEQKDDDFIPDKDSQDSQLPDDDEDLSRQEDCRDDDDSYVESSGHSVSNATRKLSRSDIDRSVKHLKKHKLTYDTIKMLHAVDKKIRESGKMDLEDIPDGPAADYESKENGKGKRGKGAATNKRAVLPTGKCKEGETKRRIDLNKPKKRSAVHNLDLLKEGELLNKEKGQIKTKDNFELALKNLQENHAPNCLKCRDKEKKIIEDFMESGLENKGNSQTLCKPGLTQTFQECPESVKLPVSLKSSKILKNQRDTLSHLFH